MLKYSLAILGLGLSVASSTANAIEDLGAIEKSACSKAIDKAVDFDKARLWDPFKLSHTTEFSPGASEACNYKMVVSTREGAEASRALMTHADFNRCTPLRYRREILNARSKERWVRISNIRREMEGFKQFVFAATGGELLTNAMAAEIPGVSLILEHGVPALQRAFDKSCGNRKTRDIETTLDHLLAAGGSIFFHRDTVKSSDGDRTAIREAYTYEVKVGDEFRVTPFMVRFLPVKVVR